MGILSKEKNSERFFVKGKRLTCPVCHDDRFVYREAQLNTKLASLFNFDWANKSASCYICANCSNIQWFMEKL